MSTPRILIVRTSALGDIVHALPVLTALKRHYPDARVGWVVEEAFAPLLQGHPLLDELLVIRSRTWRKHISSGTSWREAATLVRQLHQFSPEIALDLMGNHKAGVLSALSLADRRIGHRSENRREPSSALWCSELVAARGHHAVDRMLSVIGGLGLPVEEADFAPHLLVEEPLPGLPSRGPVALIHPATGWGNKDYPEERWAAVAQMISESAQVLIVPGPGEEQRAARIAAGAPGSETLPPPHLPGLVYLQRRSNLVLGGDTGPVHLAHALGTPVVCVMGPTDPVRHGPYAASNAAVSKRLPCSFCHKRLDDARACLLGIDEEVVAEKALRALRFASH